MSITTKGNGRDRRKATFVVVASDEENELIGRAAQIERRPKAQFVRVAALEKAQTILKQFEAEEAA